MLENAVKQQLKDQFADAQVEVKLEGNHCHIVMVTTAFEGLRPVKRQQQVYAVLNERIASGEIHAVHLSLSTPAETSA